MKRKLILFAIFLTGLSSHLPAAEDDYAAGKKIFETRCVDVCHQAPARGQLKPTQWRIVLNTMQKRMEQSDMTPLSEQELEQLLSYLTAR